MDRFSTRIEPKTPATFRVPTPRTPIIGRQEDRARVAALVHDGYRSITLVGAGGVGKTRLALAVAHDLRDRFDGRVGWVSLGESTEPDSILDTVARALGVSLPTTDRVTALAEALGEAPALLVVDNMEHLTGGAGVLGALLDQAPQLTLLVTSRVALRLTGEREVRVDPFPPIARVDDADALESHPAVRLFAERARAADASFDPDELALRRVAAIVRRLDYLPLAIELAAARVRHFPLEEIESLLSSTLDLLTGGPRDAPDRQRTIRETIGWSYALLTPEQQQVFRSVAVFPGVFSLESAIELCQTPDTGRIEIIDRISHLVDQHLLVRTNEPGPARYVMLGSIREFGQAQLRAAGDDHAVRSRLLDVVMARVGGYDRYASENLAWLETVEAGMDDIRAAFGWAIEAGEGIRALDLAVSIAGWFTSRGNPVEGVRFMQAALDSAPAAPDRTRFEALRHLVWLLALTGQLSDALGHVHELEELGPVLDDPEAMVKVEQMLGALECVAGDYEAGRRHTERAVELAEEFGALVRFKGLLFNLATLSEILGQYDVALAYYRRGVALIDRTEHPGMYAMHIAGMASLALRMGDPVKADRLLRDVWSDIAELRNLQVVSSALYNKAEIFLAAGDAVRAARCFGAADRLVESNGRVLIDLELEEIASFRRRLADVLPADALAAEIATGQAMDLDEITSDVLLPVAMPANKPAAPASLLTPREIEVGRLLVEGMTNPEIGERLFISERTVQSHVANIMAKLGVNSRAAAAARIVQEGLLPAAASPPNGGAQRSGGMR